MRRRSECPRRAIPSPPTSRTSGELRATTRKPHSHIPKPGGNVHGRSDDLVSHGVRRQCGGHVLRVHETRRLFGESPLAFRFRSPVCVQPEFAHSSNSSSTNTRVRQSVCAGLCQFLAVPRKTKAGRDRTRLDRNAWRDIQPAANQSHAYAANGDALRLRATNPMPSSPSSKNEREPGSGATSVEGLVWPFFLPFMNSLPESHGLPLR